MSQVRAAGRRQQPKLGGIISRTKAPTGKKVDGTGTTLDAEHGNPYHKPRVTRRSRLPGLPGLLDASSSRLPR